MAFQLSPGVLVTEKDLTSVVPAVGTSIGGTVITASWGPADEIYTISSENELVQYFSKPPASETSWLTAASFLAYTSTLKVIRSVGSATAKNATSIDGGILIKNSTVYANSFSSGNADDYGMWAAKYPGGLGNSLRISFADSDTFENKVLTGTITTNTSSNNVTGVGTEFLTECHVGGVLKTDAGAVIGKIDSIDDDTNLTLTSNAASSNGGLSGAKVDWAYKDAFDYAPSTTESISEQGGSNDEFHIIVVDEYGMFTGVAGSILEKYAGVSKAASAKDSFGGSNYYPKVITQKSRYIVWMDHPVGPSNWGYPVALAFDSNQIGSEMNVVLVDGTDGTLTLGDLQSSYSLFANDELVDVNLIFVSDNFTSTWADQTTLQNYVIDNITSVRRDCLAFISPARDSVVGVTDGAEAANIIAESNTRSSYAIKDSGWKYMYNRYDDEYTWVPCSGDTAGLCAATDRDADPWFSPAGYNRGQIKNAVKLAYSPDKSDRDALYKAGVNPIVGFPGSGIVLFGDKTLLEKPSAFDRINVRRLFIVLEKAIATAAKFQLFEFNDAFTRAQFKNLVEPFLRDVQGRRGVVDFKVVCDETNNTGQVIDSNSFVADIFIQPSRSINFIQLNFIATRSGISFNEIGA